MIDQDLGLAPENTYPVLSLRDLLTIEVQPKLWLLDGLIRQRELVQVYGARGLGKTWLSLSLAYAIATGGQALKWRAPEARTVLYVDGEMDIDDLQARAKRLMISDPRTGVHLETLFFLSSHHVEGGIGDMADERVRDRIDATADKVGAEIIFIDNLSCLFSTKDENAAAEFNIFNNWLLAHRRAGRSVLFVHHAGKSGQQRGTSRREDSLDLVLALKATDEDEDEPRTGCRFNLVFEKARSLTGEQTAAVRVLREGDTWNYEPAKTHRNREIVSMAAGGMTQRQIADAVGCKQCTVSKILSKSCHRAPPG